MGLPVGGVDPPEEEEAVECPGPIVPALGATGLAQCTELVWQLRGQGDQRQVEGATIALQHNLGLGGACVVTMYRKD